MIKLNKFDYPWLQAVMDIPELVPTPAMMNYDGLSHEDKLKKMKDNVAYAVSDRAKFIQSMQRKNLEHRFLLLERAKNDIELQESIKEACRRDPLYFFNMFLRTYNPRLQHPYNHLPFLTYPFQDEFILEWVKAVEEWYDIRVEKSRDMWFSWLVLWILTRGFCCKDWTSLIGSYKEKYVHTVWDMDSSFERILYMLERLPSWLKPQDITSKFTSISSKEWGEKEIGWDAGQAFGTGWRRKVIFKDEFALRQFDETALRKTKDVTNCRIIGWTPEGTTNVYWKVMTNHVKYRDMIAKKIRLLRNQHPLKTTMRYNMQKATRTKIDLAKEIDISYDDSVTGAVYPNFRTLSHFGEHKYNPWLKLYRSRDFGLDSNAMIWRQKDFKYNLLYIVKTVKVVDRDLRKTAWLVIWTPTPGFQYSSEEYEFMAEVKKRGKWSWDYWDPYNSDNRTTVDKKNTIRSVLAEYWIHLQTSRSNTVEWRIRTATLALPRIYVDTDCMDFIQSIIQSKYPQIKETSQTTADNRKPVHDENSHYRTAFEYFLDLEPENATILQGTSVDISSLM